MTRTSDELNQFTTILAFDIKDNEWSNIKKVNLPALDFNPYAYIEIGAILDNGERETCIKTITLYWDGTYIIRYNR